MTTIKIILLEIALLVMTPVHHATPAKIYLIEEEGSFLKGDGMGYINFQFGFRNLTIAKIKHNVASIRGNSENEGKKLQQSRLTIAYFKYLLGGLLLVDYNFKTPSDWCSSAVDIYRINGNMGFNVSKDDVQVPRCTSYIVGYMCTREDAASNENIFNTFYANWSFEKLQVNINYYYYLYNPKEELMQNFVPYYLIDGTNRIDTDMTPIFIEKFSLNYFYYVVQFIENEVP